MRREKSSIPLLLLRIDCVGSHVVGGVLIRDMMWYSRAKSWSTCHRSVLEGGPSVTSISRCENSSLKAWVPNTLKNKINNAESRHLTRNHTSPSQVSTCFWHAFPWVINGHLSIECHVDSGHLLFLNTLKGNKTEWNKADPFRHGWSDPREHGFHTTAGSPQVAIFPMNTTRSALL